MYDYSYTDQENLPPWVYGYSSIYHIQVEDGVRSIGDYAFDSLTNVSDISLGEDVRSIGVGAFLHCDSLSSISLPEGITALPDMAFLQCVALREVTIPATVREIGYGAFYGCPLETVNFAGTRRQWRRISIDGENDPLETAEIVFLGGNNGMTLEDSFEDRTGGAAEINCEDPAAGDFTISSSVPCIAFYQNGTEYVRIAAESVSGESDVYGFTLPEGCDDDSVRILVAVRCDLNGDGSVTGADADLALEMAAGNQEYGDMELLIGDINGDGSLTSTDALQILRLSNGQRTVSWGR